MPRGNYDHTVVMVINVYSNYYNTKNVDHDLLVSIHRYSSELCILYYINKGCHMHGTRPKQSGRLNLSKRQGLNRRQCAST